MSQGRHAADGEAGDAPDRGGVGAQQRDTGKAVGAGRVHLAAAAVTKSAMRSFSGSWKMIDLVI